jgi:ABC-type transport system involved in cytochrome bd biosynthesis fused ATPase/permease subunit
LIAHRSESLAFCDRVFALDEGRLAAAPPEHEAAIVRIGNRS